MSKVYHVTCHCGATVDYDNPTPGATNVGHFHQETGWYNMADTFSYEPIWVCPECAKKAIEHAKAIVALLGIDHAEISSILSWERWKHEDI